MAEIFDQETLDALSTAEVERVSAYGRGFLDGSAEAVVILKKIMAELDVPNDVPGEDYPANVRKAYVIAKDAVEMLEDALSKTT